MFGASCAEPNEARLHAANDAIICCFSVKANKESEGKGERQTGSLLSRTLKQCFVYIHLARFPFLLSRVFVFDVKHITTILFGAARGPKRGEHTPSNALVPCDVFGMATGRPEQVPR